MKLTENLREKLENAKSEEAAKAILSEFKGAIEEAGLILDDEELSQVTGGFIGWYDMFQASKEMVSGSGHHPMEYTGN